MIKLQAKEINTLLTGISNTFNQGKVLNLLDENNLILLEKCTGLSSDLLNQFNGYSVKYDKDYDEYRFKFYNLEGIDTWIDTQINEKNEFSLLKSIEIV